MSRCAVCPVAAGRLCRGAVTVGGTLCARVAADPRRWGPAVVAASADLGPSLPVLDPWTYITTARLLADTGTLLARLPADIDLVVAVARSGLLPGGLVAYQLHLPLWTVSRPAGLIDIGHGVRLENGRHPTPRHVLLIDDTAAHGRELAACTPLVGTAFPGARITRAVVYARPEALAAVDLCVAAYPGCHYLEWNWANAGHGAACGYDFDGILCVECPPADDDDGPRYRRFLATAAPLFLPRRLPVPLCVTGRHERYRPQTMAWLDRHRVRVERLVMRDWDGAHDPLRIAAFKARHYAASDCGLFAESEPAQAERINHLTGKPVLCPAAGRVYPPRDPKPRVEKGTPHCIPCAESRP